MLIREMKALMKYLKPLVMDCIKSRHEATHHALLSERSLRLTNLETEVTVNLNCDGAAVPRLLVPLKLLREVEGDLVLAPGDGRVVATFDGRTETFTAPETQDFPQLAKLKWGPGFTFPVTPESMNAMLPFTTEDQLRPGMSGIHVTADKAIATDGRRLVVETFPKSNPPLPRPVTVLALAVKTLFRLGNPPTDRPIVQFSIDEDRLQFSGPGWRLITRDLNADISFPQFQQALDTVQEQKCNSLLFPEGFAKTLKAFKKGHNVRSFPRLDIMADNNQGVMVLGAREQGERKMSFDAVTRGPVETHLNVDYLIDALEAFDGCVALHVSVGKDTEAEPVSLAQEGTPRTVIVMPMRVL